MLDRLLGASAPAVIPEAARLCKLWLWEKQQRTIAYRDADEANVDVLARLHAALAPIVWEKSVQRAALGGAEGTSASRGP